MAAVGALLLLALAAVVVGFAVPNHAKYALAFSGGALIGVLALKRVELVYVVLVVTGLLGYRYGQNYYAPAEILAIFVLLVHGRSLGQRALIPAALVIYCAWFLVAATRVAPSTLELKTAAHYILPPLVAIATTVVARDPATRRRIIVILLVAATIEALIVFAEAARYHFSLGHNPDAVTGTLGPSGANLVGFVLLLPATICLAIFIERAWRPKLILIAGLLMAITPVLTQSRASLFFLPVVLAAVLMSYGLSIRRSRGARRALALLLPCAALVPVLLIALEYVNPISLTGYSYNLTTLSGIKADLFAPHPGGERASYGLQLKIAVDQSVASGPATALAGNGIGAGRPDNTNTVATIRGASVTEHLTATNPNSLYPFLNTTEQASGTWMGTLLAETGWIGVIVFLGMLGWLITLGRRSRVRLPQGSLDRALLVALPGVAWLTLLGAFYQPVLAEAPYNLFFWTLVGVCIAIAKDARSNTRATPPQIAAA